MTLLELLRQELPKRGGWPEGAICVIQDNDGQVCFSSRFEGLTLTRDKTDWLNGEWGGNWSNEFYDVIADDRATAIVTREQYEATGWDGTGLPPVGVECEYSLNAGVTWFRCKIDYILGTQGLIMLADVYEGGQFVGFAEYEGKLKFRPIRTEADKKRDAAIEAIDWYMPECILDTPNESGHAKKIYDAIAAGKIPGVKLEV